MTLEGNPERNPERNPYRILSIGSLQEARPSKGTLKGTMKVTIEGILSVRPLREPLKEI